MILSSGKPKGFCVGGGGIASAISSSSIRLFINEGWPLSGHERVTEARLLLRLWSEHPGITTGR